MEDSTVPTDANLRASDREREAIAAQLGDHLAAGRLDFAEFNQRLDAAFAATTRGQLDAVLRDLPQPHTAPLPAPRAAGAPASARSAWASWSLTGFICLVIWAVTSVAQGHPLGFWPAWVIGPWGLVLFSRTVLGRGAVCSRA